MKKTKIMLRTAAFAAAVLLTAGVPLSAPNGASSARTVYAADEEAYTTGSTATLDYYNFSDRIEIVHCKSDVKELVIPSEIESLPVTAVRIYGCQYSDITSLTLPDAFTDNTASATITFYGSKETWEKVEKPSNDPFLKNAKMVFDESHTEPEEKVLCDINADGKCNAADAVLLHKWLLTKPNIALTDWEVGDLNQNGKLDAGDLSKLKMLILSGK